MGLDRQCGRQEFSVIKINNKKINTMNVFIKFIALAIVVSISSCATSKQRLPALDNGRVGIQKTVSFSDSITISELMSRARLYFAEKYRSAKDVIQLDDINSGIIVGKAFSKTGFNTHFTVKIECKPGRYRYTIYDVYVVGGNNAANLYGTEIPAEKYWSMPMGKSAGNKVGDAIKSVASDLEEAMSIKVQSRNKDW
jgi:Domain of unknown function (DUF4468) with TBP-like fold